MKKLIFLITLAIMPYEAEASSTNPGNDVWDDHFWCSKDMFTRDSECTNTEYDLMKVMRCYTALTELIEYGDPKGKLEFTKKRCANQVNVPSFFKP